MDDAPSAWIQRWSPLVPEGASLLDVACGRGRHLRWFAARGAQVTGVDRDADALAKLQGLGELVRADIESGPWPFAGRHFDAVVVTNYLWRPLLRAIVEAVAPGGVLLYETFADGQQAIGKPSRADFLLQPGELLDLCRGTLRVVGYEDGFVSAPDRFVQRVAAVRERAACLVPARHRLPV